MRFGVKPDRPNFLESVRSRYSSSTYKVPSDSENSSNDEYEEEEVFASSDSEDSFIYGSESEVPIKAKRSKGTKSAPEQRELTEAMASIRLHASHHDPLDDWRKSNKRDALEAAQARMQMNQMKLMKNQLTKSRMEQEAVNQEHRNQQEAIQRAIQARQRMREEEERRLQRDWEERNKRIWDQVDKAAALVEARLEADRKKAEAEARRLQEEKEKKEKAEREHKEKVEAERRRVAEEKAKAAEEERKRKEVEEQERIKVEEKQRREKEQLSKFDAERKRSGLTTPKEDWDTAMAINQKVKHGHLKRIKEDSVQRRQWSPIRRGITLRIGQLTDSNDEILRISTQIFETIRALDPNSDIYYASLSALAKAIILQAETEVTAKLDTAGPLAAVVINLFNLQGFEEVLWAKMVIRTGGWLIGYCVTKKQGQDDKEFRKLAGYREDENQVERQMRLGGVISLFFAICTSPKATSPLPTNFWPTKIWSFIARIMADARLLRQSIAPYLLHSCLEVAAVTGLSMFGRQWNKLLIAIGQASQEEGRVGASDDAGKTARVRLQIKAEKLLTEASSAPFRA